MKPNLFKNTSYLPIISVICIFFTVFSLTQNNRHDILHTIVGFCVSLIVYDLYAQVLSREELQDRLRGEFKEKFDAIDQLMKEHFGGITDLIKSDNIGVITEIEQTKVFRDFIGDVYDAYNSPMEYELEKIDERMDFHVKRYSNPKFKMAHYYYPILSSPVKKFVKEWRNGIYAFYKILNNDKRLTSEQKTR